MHSVSRWAQVAGLVALLVQCTSSTSTPATALSVTPSTNWYGDDGSWSAISIRVGTPQQWLDVIVSTVSSETWVVGGACGSPPDADCVEMRGNLFYPQNSSTWHDIGLYYFDVDKQLGNYGYGDYGLEVLTFGSTGVTIPSALISVFNGSGPTNTTSYFDGMFGVGITPGEFNVTVPKPAISALVEDEAAILSHSYGFTAGAVYQLKGQPNSLTLGGYDANRFVPHDITFSLNNNQLPQTYIDSISVISASPSSQWSSGEELLFISDRVSAIIDSSTPFLWLPESVCDRFAQSLGLVYDSTVNLYTFGSNSTQHGLLYNSSLTFTFSLSDISTSSTAVNITLPYAAFDLQLMYPAIGKSYIDSNSPMNYFPLRQAASEAQYTIGRAFLQEAYIITDYERNTFSIHQAVHTSDPIGNTSIVPITRPGDSTFSGPPSSKKSLPTGGIIGAAVGAAVIIAGMIFIVVYFCKRRRVKRGDSSVDEKSIESKPSLISRLLGRQRPPLIHEATGSTNYPTEVGADATHERFELPAPLGPAELDSESGTLDGTTERNSSSGDSSTLTAYERAKRKLERQQAAAAAALAKPPSEAYPVEKTETDVAQVAHYRAPDTESPVSPLGAGPESGGSLTIGGSGTPSPVSPGFVSPPTSPTEAPPPPAYRRINPVNVVYAGRLPDNVRLPKIVPRIIGPDGRTVRVDETMRTEDVNLGTNSSLGSHYTENEEIQEQDLYGSGDTHIVSPIVERNPGSGSGSGSGSGDAEIVSPIQSNSSGNGSHGGESSRNITTSTPLRPEPNLRGDTQIREMLDPWGSRRRLDGEDLVHIPQPAENRFSWEEERISGNENENETL